MNKKNKTIFLNENKKQLIKMFLKIIRKTNIEKWVEKFFSRITQNKIVKSIL